MMRRQVLQKHYLMFTARATMGTSRARSVTHSEWLCVLCAMDGMGVARHLRRAHCATASRASAAGEVRTRRTSTGTMTRCGCVIGRLLQMSGVTRMDVFLRQQVTHTRRDPCGNGAATFRCIVQQATRAARRMVRPRWRIHGQCTGPGYGRQMSMRTAARHSCASARQAWNRTTMETHRFIRP